MAVRLVSDLVMDVMRAAEPARAQAAARKLATQDRATVQPAFARALGTTTTPKTLTHDIVADVMAAAEPARLARAEAKLGGNGASPAGVAQKFQSVLLANALDAMMPRTDGGLYGAGTAGEVWRGMANQQMAGALASRDVLGLNQTLNDRLGTDTTATAAWPFMTSTRIRPFTTT